MILVRSPLRISLGGGGTDLPSYYRDNEGAVWPFSVCRFSFDRIRLGGNLVVNLTGKNALMLEANPNLSAEDVRAILRNSTLDLGQSGYDYAYGWGRINGFEAAQRAAQNLR